MEILFTKREGGIFRLRETELGHAELREKILAAELHGPNQHDMKVELPEGELFCRTIILPDNKYYCSLEVKNMKIVEGECPYTEPESPFEYFKKLAMQEENINITYIEDEVGYCIKEYIGVGEVRAFKHMDYYPELKYPVCTGVIKDHIEYDNVVFYMPISQEDYLYICTMLKQDPDKALKNPKVWANIELLSGKEEMAKNTMQSCLEAEKVFLLNPAKHLLKKKQENKRG